MLCVGYGFNIMGKTKISSIGIWVFTVLFFAYQFILRLSPGVFIDEIMLKQNVGAATFGLIASAYYIGYAGMQIPVGICLNKFGIRRVVSISALVCSLGNLPLLINDHWVFDLVGRFVIGIGSTAGVLGAVHAVRLYFPSKHISKMIGVTVTLGLLGAIYGKSINRFLLEEFGFEESIIYLAIPGVIISLLVMFCFKEDAKNCNDIKQSGITLSGLKEIIKDGKIIWLSIAGGLMVGPLESFADVFGEPYLVTVYGFNARDAGYLTASAIYFGFCVGAPLLAAIADKFKCHYTINIICGFAMAIIFHLILEKMINGYLLMFVSAFIIGVMSSYQVILMSTVAGMVPVNLGGLAIAVVNMFNMSAGMLFNAFIGGLLDYYWTGEMVDGKRIYSEIAYGDALYILPVTLMFGAIIFFILRPDREVTEK